MLRIVIDLDISFEFRRGLESRRHHGVALPHFEIQVSTRAASDLAIEAEFMIFAERTVLSLVQPSLKTL